MIEIYCVLLSICIQVSVIVETARRVNYSWLRGTIFWLIAPEVWGRKMKEGYSQYRMGRRRSLVFEVFYKDVTDWKDRIVTFCIGELLIRMKNFLISKGKIDGRCQGLLMKSMKSGDTKNTDKDELLIWLRRYYEVDQVQKECIHVSFFFFSVDKTRSSSSKLWEITAIIFILVLNCSRRTRKEYDSSWKWTSVMGKFWMSHSWVTSEIW